MNAEPQLASPGQRLSETRELFLMKALQYAYDRGDDAGSLRIEEELAKHLEQPIE